MSWYLTIRSDASYTRFAPTDPLVEFLVGMQELRQTGLTTFEAAEGQPWVAVILAACDSKGCYGSIEATPPEVNVVELVCSFCGNSAWYDALANRISAYLGWTAFDDHDEQEVRLLAESNPAELPVVPCDGIA